MADAKYDVLGIGNALFDVLVRTDEKFLVDHGMTKGSMALIDEARAASIYRDMGSATTMSGGSAANTIVGVAGFGARAVVLMSIFFPPKYRTRLSRASTRFALARMMVITLSR